MLAARQMPDGFESSSTNMASDHGVVNARRSMATTCGRSAYTRRRISTAAAGGAVTAENLVVGSRRALRSRRKVFRAAWLGVRLAAVVGDECVAVGRFPRRAEPAHLQGAHAMQGRIVRRDHRPGSFEPCPEAYRP